MDYDLSTQIHEFLITKNYGFLTIEGVSPSGNFQKRQNMEILYEISNRNWANDFAL